ncbi:response regulator transcription factor [Robiginitalea sp. SC105]|uniref:response regulator transcription factor n=1 Tax=Robiginitalea sp. SC105 TaxID=2762332 RepID=UPI001639C9E8|nr:response regulator transcription factor [Robiginitalea sp. SC105]MBC2839086.1 response regulator transcription factor [Robiginitalea sp. SC105]
MENNQYKLLLVEDDTSLGYLLTEYLGMKGFELRWIQAPEEVMPLLEQRAFDLLILDVMMPGKDGFTLGREIHERFPGLPFIFLTARSMKIDVLKGFSVGAVDYLKKPIDEEELVVRIEALLSRLETTSGQEPHTVQQLGRYTFDSLNQKLEFEGEELSLTNRESELLAYLARNSNRLCTHGEILKRIWGRNDYFNRKSLNVFITRLRKLLERDASLKIENIHGQGFIFRMPANGD